MKHVPKVVVRVVQIDRVIEDCWQITDQIAFVQILIVSNDLRQAAANFDFGHRPLLALTEVPDRYASIVHRNFMSEPAARCVASCQREHIERISRRCWTSLYSYPHSRALYAVDAGTAA
jgi:hypothetical protein